MEDKLFTYNGESFLYSPLKAESIFTPEDSTDEHRLIAKTAKRFLESEIWSNNEAIEQQGAASRPRSTRAA